MPVVLITGCSSGFGEAMALAFMDKGFQVLATMRKPSQAPASLKALAEQSPADFVLGALDIGDPASRKQAVDLAIERFGRIDLLINNAGISARGSCEDVPEDLWRAMFETNLFGPMELIRLVLPIMRAQGGGRIINVTSVAAAMKTPFLAPYCASKHALDAATAALDTEVRSFGVRAVCLMPGPFKTALPQNSLDRVPSEPYAKTGASFNAAFDNLEAHAAEDFAPVIEAALTAATAADPALRYVVGAEKLAILPPILQAWAPLQGLGMHLTGQS